MDSIHNNSLSTLYKHGSCSILLGQSYYSGHFPVKPKKVLKISKVFEKHDEMKYTQIIKSIKDYEDYYAIPEEEIKELLPSSAFYKYLRSQFEEKNESLFNLNSSLHCYYVNYAGSLDILDSIDHMTNLRDRSIWSSSSAILEFAKYVMEGLKFLHEKKICHLDIKCENIMIDIDARSSKYNRYRIVDFGFSSIEPFDDYVGNVRGTPGYFPKHFSCHVEPGLPVIYANDMEVEAVTQKVPMALDYKMVYKVDSFCFGRVLNCVYYHFCDIFGYGGWFFTTKSRKKLKQLIATLLEYDVYQRPTIIQAYRKFFEE